MGKLIVNNFELCPLLKVDEAQDWLCFTLADRDSQTGTIRLVNNTTTTTYFQISWNGVTWSDVTLTGGSSTASFVVANMGKFYIRGNNTTLGTSTSTTIGHRFVLAGKFYVSGNIMSLIQNNGQMRSSVPASCFNGLFKDCTGLLTAPKLPSTAIGNYAYSEMFSGCTSLIVAPVLPATLSGVKVPTQPYYQMFYGCSSLNYIVTYATNWTNTTSTEWVYEVSSTGTFVRKTSNTWVESLGNDSGKPPLWNTLTVN